MKIVFRKILGAVCALGVLSGGAAVAAPQSISNSNFSISYDDGTSFGQLSLVNNAISFNFSNPAGPLPWIARSVNGSGLSSQSDSITLTLTINNASYAQGYRFGSVLWLEGGDYKRSNSASTVAVTGSLSAQDAANANTITQNGLTVLSPGLSAVGSNKNWFAQASLDANTACSGAGCINAFASQAQTLMLTVSNTLSAESSSFGEVAFIEKKLGAGQFTLLVTQVPEASTWAMMLAGLGAVGFFARRRAVQS